MQSPRFSPAVALLLSLTLAPPAYATDASESGEPVTDDLPAQVRGVIRAPARVTLASDLAARIDRVHAREGDSFDEGVPLISFDCTAYAARQRVAEAELSAAAVDLKQKRHLRRLGAAGQGEVDLAAAETARAGASLDATVAQMRDCVIEAPFDGRVAELHARAFEMPEPGRPLMTIIDNSYLEIELIIPSAALKTLSPGDSFPFRVDETGGEVTAVIDRFGAEIDPVSQTAKVIAVIHDLPDGVLAGMSGSAAFRTQSGRLR